MASDIMPGMHVKVEDRDEPFDEKVWFVVTGIKGNRVKLLSPSGSATWTHAKDILVKAWTVNDSH